MWLIDKILEALDSRNKVRVLVHEAYFDNNPQLFYFIKVFNLSPKNNFTITHVWIEDSKNNLEVLSNKLPHKLEISDVWETWYQKDRVKDQTNIFKNVRIVLSNGKTYKSKQNFNVRPKGFIAS